MKPTTKEMLDFLYWISGAATFTEKQIEIYRAIIALIEKRTVTREQVDKILTKHIFYDGHERDTAESCIILMLAELGIGIEDT